MEEDLKRVVSEAKAAKERLRSLKKQLKSAPPDTLRKLSGELQQAALEMQRNMAASGSAVTPKSEDPEAEPEPEQNSP